MLLNHFSTSSHTSREAIGSNKTWSFLPVLTLISHKKGGGKNLYPDVRWPRYHSTILLQSLRRANSKGGCKSDLTYEMWLPWELKVAFGFCHGPVVWATPWDWRNEARSVRSPSMTQSQLAGTWNEQLSWRLHCTAQHGKDQQLDVVQGRFNKR